MLPSRRGRRERRDEYRADVCALIAERTAALERDIESMLGQGVASGSRLLPPLREFSVGLSGQLPRARLAGLDAAVTQMTGVTSSFLGRWYAAEGYNSAELKKRELWIAELIDNGASQQEATAQADHDLGPANDGRSDQEALVLALGNYLITVRHAIQNHAQDDNFVPPAPADWPALFSAGSASDPSQMQAPSLHPATKQDGTGEARS